MGEIVEEGPRGEADAEEVAVAENDGLLFDTKKGPRLPVGKGDEDESIT